MLKEKSWRLRAVRLIIGLWALQVLWLFWHFSPEAINVAQRLAHQQFGHAIRQEDPLYRWTTNLKTLIPEHATYVLLDDYSAGKEIEVRYYLTPRHHVLLPPQVPASFLFYTLHQDHASFLLIRDPSQPLGPGAWAASHGPAFQTVELPGPGRVFRVEDNLLRWGFYD
jgi:hypothetical protein